MEVIKHAENIIELKFPSQYLLNSTLIRMQEFYESPNDRFRGKHFTLDEYMDWYAASNKSGVFDYFTYWYGFNLPGEVLINFFKTFDDTRPKEQDIFDALLYTLCKIDSEGNFVGWNTNKFYVIGTFEYPGLAKTVAHELAHAYYYLDPGYRSSCEALYRCLSPVVRAKVAVRLIDIGYSEEVIEDETQAYFATDTEEKIRERFKLDADDDISVAFEYAALYDTYSKSVAL